MSDEINIIEKAISHFTEELEARGLRKTPERFAILREIYSLGGHLDAEDLFLHMKNQEYRVSRATVYNTLELLVEVDLVKKQQFGNNITLFEKSLGYKQHDHLICTKCGKVIEFCDPRIQQTKSMVEELIDFEIAYHSLNIYGLCGDCRKK
ncbi:MAG TPA: transcriptional repressor [Saprospiraceae bacterium]|nr:transcriptional repressor [Saprospiraceae bacterium]